MSKRAGRARSLSPTRGPEPRNPRSPSDFNASSDGEEEVDEITPLKPVKKVPKSSSFSLDVQQSFHKAVKLVQTAFVENDSELSSNWIVVESDSGQIDAMNQALEAVRDAFLFSTSLTENKLDESAQEIISRCEKVAERVVDQCDMRDVLSTNWSDMNVFANLANNLKEIKGLVTTPVVRRDKAAERKIGKRIDRFVALISTSFQSIRNDIQNHLGEMDDILAECNSLLVDVVTFLHMRGRTADFSGTGVAAGAAGVVAGLVITTAAMLTVPVSGGLSVPFLVAGKSLLVTGAATLAPCGLMLRSHGKQLKGLTDLVKCLKARIEIMQARREVVIMALNACVEADFNTQQVGVFCQDATELELSSYDNSLPFMNIVEKKLAILEESVNAFGANPSLFHYCHDEQNDNGLLLPTVEDK
ncbi:transmembrane protein [Thraustotheca clavata]|uniref:Transmembrane protein n=1 Tax=Thraustotheca clavata TaxID=74557 RepID=A0A1W0AAJ9_9STRA|nr:transmembrane protein [Thraustotheca clavata]